MKNTKYTLDRLKHAAETSTNIVEFLNKIDASITSMSVRAFVKKKCLEYSIDISHFKQRRNKTRGNKKDFFVILVFDRNNGRRENSARLKRALIESGIVYQCKVCNLDPIWNNIDLRLEIDHIDNDPINNVRENLRFICPNCHSQK